MRRDVAQTNVGSIGNRRRRNPRADAVERWLRLVAQQPHPLYRAGEFGDADARAGIFGDEPLAHVPHPSDQSRRDNFDDELGMNRRRPKRSAQRWPY